MHTKLPDKKYVLDKAEAMWSSVKKIFRSMSLRTQMLLILLLLLLLSLGSLTVLYSRSEAQLINKLTDNIDDITKAIQISVEELTLKGDSTERLKSYVNMLNKKGIREISILSDTSEVIASSNPQKIGTKETLEDTKTVQYSHARVDPGTEYRLYSYQYGFGRL